MIRLWVLFLLLLNAPPKDVKICLLKSPKQKTLAELLSQASRQAQPCTMAQQAHVVQAKPKPMVRNSAVSFSKPKMVSKNGVLGNKSHVASKAAAAGIVFKDPLKSGSHVIPARSPVYGKGKGKAVLLAASPGYCSDSSDDETDIILKPLVPSSACKKNQVGELAPLGGSVGAGCHAPSMSHAMVLSPMPLQVVFPSEFFDANQFAPLDSSEVPRFIDPSIYDSGVENATFVLNDEGEFIQEYHAQPGQSFHSINSESSLVKNIEALDVERGSHVEPSSMSSSTKRRKSMEDDSASSVLKRSKA